MKIPAIYMSLIIAAAIAMAASGEDARFKFSDMRQDELKQVMEILDAQIGSLKKNLGRYKKGVSPEYAEMEGKIEELESERAEAHKVWQGRDEEGKMSYPQSSRPTVG
ncbi:MAG: hypothetical protein V1682_03600 [Candidatus Omnitrophota bacterium]